MRKHVQYALTFTVQNNGLMQFLLVKYGFASDSKAQKTLDLTDRIRNHHTGNTCATVGCSTLTK
jgi:hypothetical protein